MKIKGLLFDLDGTLLDTYSLIVSSFQHTFQVHYNRELPLEAIQEFFSRPLRAAMEVMGPDKVDELIATYREHNLYHHDQMISVFAGVDETIKELHKAGILLAIVTSKTKSTAIRGLRLFNLEKYFSTVIGVEECINHKPHPEPVLAALSQLGLQPEVCIMIGDSPYDIISGHSAGVRTAAVSWTSLPWATLMSAKPDYTLEKMQDLLKLCGVK